MMFQAVLGNRDHPEYGVATIPFPIPHDQYAHCTELLEAIEIGDAVKADCQVQGIDSAIPVLMRLEGTSVNLDELNYLAKRLDSFDIYEAAQFQAMAHKLELFELKNFINLTFCCQQVTVITSFSDLAAIGRNHYINLHGGCASVDALNALDGKEMARLLIESGSGMVTPYGVVYDNGMKLEQVYDGQFFPCYYCDGGWSGTNFERPEFKRMINDIESGRINTVIVKDLSRFGREYAQMGLYIEHYFEQKGVRFIAVAEGVDSKNGLDNLVLPMTNVINSLYARQASTKTKAAHRARASSGMYMGSHAPFGYQKDPKDRHHLIVDPDAADVVKDIFQMFADGIGYVRMTKILRERKVLNPQAYFNQNNPDYYKNSDYWRKPFDWHATSVRVILNNPVYLGNVVFGRTKTKGFFDKQRIEADESEWIVKENTHEAIITRELWDTVHQMMKARRRENSTGTVQPFAGLVKCADCGSSLNVSYDKKKGRYPAVPTFDLEVHECPGANAPSSQMS